MDGPFLQQCLDSSFYGWNNNPTWPSHLSLAEVYLSLFLPFLLHYCPASLKNGLSFTDHKDTHCLRRYGITLANFLCSDYFFSFVSKFQELSLHDVGRLANSETMIFEGNFCSLKSHPHEVKGFLSPLLNAVFPWQRKIKRATSPPLMFCFSVVNDTS